MAASDFSSPSAGSFRSTQGSPDVAYEVRQTLGMGSFGIVKLAVSLGPYVLCLGFYVKFQDSLRAPLICAYLNIINPILNTCRIAKKYIVRPCSLSIHLIAKSAYCVNPRSATRQERATLSVV